ncbi:MAG: hypothetical protein K5668_07430, partial [Lachnospiraceae bacterium]|nr:hypothetical protein [Lachnospiraceae bacterium]
MKRRLKKISLILAVSLLLTSIPGSVYAEPVSDVVEEEEDATVMATETPEEEETVRSTETPEEEEEPRTEDTEEKKSEENREKSGEKPASGSEGENKKTVEKTEPSQSDNSTDIEENKNETADEGKADTVSDDAIDETVSANDAEDSLSDNSVSENEVSENSISENEVSENEIIEDEITDGYEEGGNIDITMDFDEETVAEVAEASEAKLASFTEGDAGLNAVGSLASEYYGSLEYVDDGIYDPDKNMLCWAYTAATMAEINMNKKGLRNRSDAHIDPIQIAQATYNKMRYDNYGETWNKTANTYTPDLSKTTNSVARDYTRFIGEDRKLI